MIPTLRTNRRGLLIGAAATAAAAGLGTGRGLAAGTGFSTMPTSPFATRGAAPAETREIETRHRLAVEALTPDAFAPFGTVLTEEGRERLPVDTYGESLDLYREDFESDQPVEWFIVAARPRWTGVLFLERHLQLTQTFIPIAGEGFYTVVARPQAVEEGAHVVLAEMRAFHVAPGQAIQLHRGTWHENPMPAGAPLRALVTSHAALTVAHQQDPDPALAGLAKDLERRWYRAAGIEVTLDA